MSKALVIQHVKSEGLGIISTGLSNAGLGADFVRVFNNEPIPSRMNGYKALIALGGPMGVYEQDRHPFIARELALIRSALGQRVAVLGVCLGSQMLAAAAGASVYKGGAKEIGWYGINLTNAGKVDPLFRGMPEAEVVFQWHGDTFDVPKGAQNLASSPLFQNQLIKVGPNAYGVQFHLEVTEPMIKDWITINSDEIASLKGAIDPARVLKETPENIYDLHRRGDAVIRRFLRMALQ